MILRKLAADGVRRIELFAEADNLRALRFYEKHGFAREGVFRGAFRRAVIGDANPELCNCYQAVRDDVGEEMRPAWAWMAR